MSVNYDLFVIFDIKARRVKRPWSGSPRDGPGGPSPCGVAEKGAQVIEMTELGTKTPIQPDNGVRTGLAPTREADARAAAARVARESYGKLVAYLAAASRDVPGAEDALADAFAAALAVWPAQGVPMNPEGWLATAARRRLIDAARRRRSADAASDALLMIDADLKEAAEASAAIPDRRLALMFACAHPAIEESVRAPLMLQTILGLDAAAIGSAFLVSPAAMGQRLTRAKAKIRLAGVPFRIPEREDLPARLGVALEAIYAAFSHGWAEAFADDPRGRNLAEEAIWLGRVVVSLAPDEPEAMGLLALMLYAHARREARRDAAGRYVPLSDQDTRSWDEPAIEEAERLLRAAGALGAPGRFQLEAAVQSVHAARRLTGATDWKAIALLYDTLFALTASPVVAINRAAAVAHVQGAAAGLKLLDEVGADGGLDGFEPYWVVRADLCAKTGEIDEARRAYAQAIGLQTDPAARAFLIERLAALA
jgi:RNA polymerase sigma-70 factor (ECF subfamily)